MRKGSDFRNKEVINVLTGKRLGYVSDVEIDFEKGVIEAIVVPNGSGILGILGKDNDYVIPWSSIKKVGDDIILVEFNESYSMR